MVRPMHRRRSVVLGILGLLADCGGFGSGRVTPTTESANPARGDIDQIGDLSLSSSAFEAGGRIPAKYGYSQQNVNPSLTIPGTPDVAESLTLIMDDPDALEPAGKVWLHWLVWNISPDRAEIPEAWSPTDAIEGMNDFGERGYGGPEPPDAVHTYRFKLFALDTHLDLNPDTTVEGIGRAMADHIIAQTQLEGTYAP